MTDTALTAASTGATSKEKSWPPLYLVWGALLLNVMSFTTIELIVPIPRSLGQAIAQGALPLALVLALMLNRRLAIRPNSMVVMITVLAVVSLMVSLHSVFLVGSTYRALRVLAFVVVLWLLTPWWGRYSGELLRAHVAVLSVGLATVVLGLAISPGRALAFEGRLSGVVWPIPPTQVAHYAAVVTGISALGWLCRSVRPLVAMAGMGTGAALLMLTHTRTGLIACIVAFGVAAMSLFLGSLRVRRVASAAVLVGIVAIPVLSGPISTWFLRGQTSTEASQLTGRTKVWREIVEMRRPWVEDWFGSGASNQSFGGLPIDNGWLATYVDQGYFGVIGVALIIVLLLGKVVQAHRSPHRAMALFLIVYCVIASFTETGLGTASSYLLDLFVAGALLTGRAEGDQ
ncbi:MAG: hypothetical protein CSA84_05125 [Actinomycetales bacterium]|nr:MAG: hypothetical protein CSA84_05125 [Actinomycetales bacterium]